MFISDVTAKGFKIRPWERGGSGATLACGSGSAAAATSLALAGHRFEEVIDASCPGGILRLSKIESPDRRRVSGEAKENFRGSFKHEVVG